MQGQTRGSAPRVPSYVYAASAAARPNEPPSRVRPCLQKRSPRKSRRHGFSSAFSTPPSYVTLARTPITNPTRRSGAGAPVFHSGIEKNRNSLEIPSRTVSPFVGGNFATRIRSGKPNTRAHNSVNRCCRRSDAVRGKPRRLDVLSRNVIPDSIISREFGARPRVTPRM